MNKKMCDVMERSVDSSIQYDKKFLAFPGVSSTMLPLSSSVLAQLNLLKAVTSKQIGFLRIQVICYGFIGSAILCTNL